MRDAFIIIAMLAALQIGWIMLSLLVTGLVSCRDSPEKWRFPRPTSMIARHERKYLMMNVVTSGALVVIIVLLDAAGLLCIRFDDPTVLQVLAQATLCIAGFDAYAYAVHRLMHTRFLYGYVHVVHHRSRSPRFLTAFSFHPLEWFIFGIYTPLLLMVGCQALALAIFFVVQILANVASHSGSTRGPGFWFRNPITGLLVTPPYHALHHRHVGCNYGSITTLWDRVFGTLARDFEDGTAGPRISMGSLELGDGPAEVSEASTSTK